MKKRALCVTIVVGAMDDVPFATTEFRARNDSLKKKDRKAVQFLCLQLSIKESQEKTGDAAAVVATPGSFF